MNAESHEQRRGAWYDAHLSEAGAGQANPASIGTKRSISPMHY